MEEGKICKICNKSFSNGKALGGHIRSHFLKHPLPPKNNVVVSSNNSVSSSPIFNKNNNQQKLGVKMTTLPTRRRSERRRNSPFQGISEEEAALFLIQLSRDTWNSRRKEEEEEGNNNNDNDNGNDSMVLGNDGVDVKKRVYSCEYCCKVFKSGQALGGHKKAHFSTTVPKNVKPGTLFIDLNLPPLYISSTCTNVSA